MLIFPAIDLKGGRVVRLVQGRMDESTVYAENPVEIVEDFARQGAEYLHVVDLDGAFAGKPVNDETIRRIIETRLLKVQVGGGVRTVERMDELFRLGVERIILGTIAVRSPELVKEAAQRWGNKVIVGIDAKNGYVAVEGWAETTQLKSEELGCAMRGAGVETVIYTDISRDGMMQGPNVESTVELAGATGLKVIASGGISSLDDLLQLKNAQRDGAVLEGAIVGKALYSKVFTLAEALEAVK